jgi:type I restriction enzyme S subunit
MSEWIVSRVADHADLLLGFAFKSKDFALEPLGPRLVRGDNITRGRLEWGSSTRYWPDPTAELLLRYSLREGDIVVGMDGSRLGENFAAISAEDIPALLVQRVACLRAKPTLDQGFLRYLICNPAFTSYVKSVHTGTSIPHISGAQIGAYPIAVPPLSEQRAIAEVLGALDDKVEANQRVVALSDASWLSVLKGEAGGELVPLSSLARFINGKAFTKGASGDGRVVIRIAELNSGPGASTVYSDAQVPEEHLAGPGDVLFAWSGSLTVVRWYRAEGIVNQHIFKVLPNPGIPMWLVHGRILDLLSYFRGVAADKATTMGHIQRHHLDELVLMPTAEALARLDKPCTSLWERALEAEQEGLILTALRDALLPKLLSGEIRVRETAALVRETV